MPKPMIDAVHRYFTFDTHYNISSCELCNSKLKGKHTSNLKNHLATKHRQEFNHVEDLNKTRSEKTKPVKTDSFIENLKALCVQLVMVHGRPIDMMDDVAFQAILNMAARGNVASKYLNQAAIKQAIEEKENLKVQEETSELTEQSSSSNEKARLKNPLQTDTNADASDTNKSNRPDSDLKDGLPQCRFCGELTKHFADTASMSYVADNKTSLSINGINIEINLDKSKTVCLDCDGKLKQMLEFMTLVKHAQDKLEKEVDVKIEYESNEDVDDDTNEEDTPNKSVENSIKRSKRTKRKRKKAKVDDFERVDCDLLFEVKEEIALSDSNSDEPTSKLIGSDVNDTAMETDYGHDSEENGNVRNSGFSKANTGTGESSELEMVTRALIDELVDHGTVSGKGNYG